MVLVDTGNHQDRPFSPQILTENGERTIIGNTKRKFVDRVECSGNDDDSITGRKRLGSLGRTIITAHLMAGQAG